MCISFGLISIHQPSLEIAVYRDPQLHDALCSFRISSLTFFTGLTWLQLVLGATRLSLLCRLLSAFDDLQKATMTALAINVAD